MRAARHQPFLSLAVPTCSFREPRLPARAAIKGPSALGLGGSEVVAKGLCPYLHVLVVEPMLYADNMHLIGMTAQPVAEVGAEYGLIWHIDKIPLLSDRPRYIYKMGRR